MTETAKKTQLPWEPAKCRVPMWMGGCPSGHCDAEAFGPQLPRSVLAQRETRYLIDRPAYCFGHCCPAHGGPRKGEPIIFTDGTTPQGRPMYCAVMPDFVNLQESPAGFSGNPLEALKDLARARGAS